MPPRVQVTGAAAREAAEAIAIDALAYLAHDPKRLDVFLSLSGLSAGDVRGAARRPGFLVGVLDHLCGDERLLLGFAAAQNLPPERVDAARRILAGPDPAWP